MKKQVRRLWDVVLRTWIWCVIDECGNVCPFGGNEFSHMYAMAAAFGKLYRNFRFHQSDPLRYTKAVCR